MAMALSVEPNVSAAMVDKDFLNNFFCPSTPVFLTIFFHTLSRFLVLASSLKQKSISPHLWLAIRLRGNNHLMNLYF